jgi:hypothetical protein
MEQSVRQRLIDVLPAEFMNGSYEHSPAMPHVFVDVLETCHGDERPWPGKHKNVAVWYVLADGKAVGFNENKTRGWSFPVITYPRVQRTGPLIRPDDGPDEEALHDMAHAGAQSALDGAQTEAPSACSR